MHRFCRACARALIFAAALLWSWSTVREAAAEVWSGHTKNFTRPDGADYFLPENQDLITPGVVLTRGDSQGLFNIAAEPNYLPSVSPEFTEWATSINNTGQPIVATNFSNLVFDTWVVAFGGQGTHGLPTSLTTHDAVVHLTSYDLYLDVRFTSWTQGGGGFSYLRATLPGDFNGNGTVDAADYTVWRDTQGQMVVAGDGADINKSKKIDIGDYNSWKNHLGDSVINAGAGGGGAGIPTGVPEPATIVIAGLALIALVARAAGASWNE